ncbi:MAG: efflux RND transporter periplasmic adaptor subunit [Candidatus Omnitrophota bacterium]
MRFKSLKVFAGIAVFIILSQAGCQKNEAVKKEEVQIMPVKVEKIGLRDVYMTLEYVGNIEAQDEVMIYPKVTGKVMQKIKEEGILVEKGDIIAYVDRDEVGLTFEKAPVESPLKGVIGRVYVDIGSNVSQQTPVALVVNMDRVNINLNIPEKHLPRVSIGQEANIYADAYPREVFKGMVTKMSPVLDLETRSAPIEITIGNKDHRLKSGMFVKVFLVVEEHKDMPVVLKEAIMGKDPDFYVYVVKDNKAVLRDVKLGIRQNEYFEVREGLKEGDLAVIMGQQRLKEGAEVKIDI